MSFSGENVILIMYCSWDSIIAIIQWGQCHFNHLVVIIDSVILITPWGKRHVKHSVGTLSF